MGACAVEDAAERRRSPALRLKSARINTELAVMGTPVTRRRVAES
jgi:hypothetical protein